MRMEFDEFKKHISDGNGLRPILLRIYRQLDNAEMLLNARGLVPSTPNILRLARMILEEWDRQDKRDAEEAE